MLDDGERLVPGLPAGARAARVGGRAAAVPGRAGRRGQGHARRLRAPTRSFDHLQRDGIRGLLTIVGRQADHVLPPDGPGPRRRHVPSSAATPRPCTTAEVRPPGNEDGEAYELGSRLRAPRGDAAGRAAHLRVRADRARAARGGDAPCAARTTSTTSGARCGSAWARARAASASTAPPGSCIRSTGSTVNEAAPRAARVPPGALEGRLPDPLRRPAAPGAARRLDLPGAARRRAPARGRRPAKLDRRRGAAHVSHHDAIVVGCGLAGLTAAVRLAEAGARVLVLAKGVGATHLAPATIDVLGYQDGNRVEKPAEALDAPRTRASVRARGRRRGAGGGSTGSRRGSRRARSRRTRTRARSSRTCCCPRPSASRGRPRSCPRRWPAARSASGDPVVAVGFRGLKDFHPALLADMLSRVGRARAFPWSSS